MNKRQKKKYTTTYMRIRDSIEKTPDPLYILDAYLRPYRIGRRKAAIVRSMIYCLSIDRTHEDPSFLIFLEWNPYECGDWITKFRKNLLSLRILPYEESMYYYIHKKFCSKQFAPSLNEIIESAVSNPIWAANTLAHFYGIEEM